MFRWDESESQSFINMVMVAALDHSRTAIFSYFKRKFAQEKSKVKTHVQVGSMCI